MKKKSSMHQLTIAWLYPDLMSTYGDRGNLIALQKRCEWRGIEVTIKNLSIGSDKNELESCDLLFMGGGEDRQQKLVADDMRQGKGKVLEKMIEGNIPGLYICGAYQFLGNFYKEADGTKIDGLHILDLYTINPGQSSERLIGNIAVSINHEYLGIKGTIVGFENHGGRTYLGKDILPLGTVIKGFGNNGEDQQEGAIYKNSIGSYFHGPLLPKNPRLSDFLIKKALEKKYNKEITIEELDDTIEQLAQDTIARQLGIDV